jgi:DEAD/DEAH box helicase domain-containing protein
VNACRSGYSAVERRAIENALHTGVLCGVAATNALELGIDIGRLDVTLHLSFPHSVASMWQQAGRAGVVSAAALVCGWFTHDDKQHSTKTVFCVADWCNRTLCCTACSLQLWMLAGRREQTSLSVYVAFDGPLDQHFMRCPSKLFGATVETPQVDPSNLILLQQHVVCAAVELPLVPYLDEQFFGPVCFIAGAETAHTVCVTEQLGPLSNYHLVL